MNYKLLFIPVLLLYFNLNAQTNLPLSQPAKRAYENGTRSLKGVPGPNYWQNSADYHLDIDFNPQTNLLTGMVEITYFNNSPDTLQQLWLKLYPNLYKKGVERNSNIPEEDLNEGLKISSIRINNVVVPTDSLLFDGTNMVALISPLEPKATINIEIKYNYILNDGYHVRTGQIRDGAFFVAYFFPRVAVYDDIDGWDKTPYKGMAEFYNDYSNFDVHISVPEDFVVWATGELKNPEEVLNQEHLERLQKAESSSEIISVVDTTDIKKRSITAGNPINTFKFSATNVTDFAFALSDYYVWESTSVLVDSVSGRRARVDAIYNPEHVGYKEWINFASRTIEAMTYRFPKIPYPYSHLSVFDGRAEMEYPMMVNGSYDEDRAYAIGIVDHEIFHSIFPFYVGTNEAKHAWMDEGWAAMGEWIISSMVDSTVVSNVGIMEYGKYSGHPQEKPIITATTELDRTSYTFNSYVKAGLGFLFLKDYIGEKAFGEAFHNYVEQWAGKHPIPEDLFFSFNESTGINLNWFWQKWFFEDDITDLGIEEVLRTSDGYLINIKNSSLRPLPIDLDLVFADGTTEKIHRNIGVWMDEELIEKVSIKTSKELKEVRLGDIHVPDKYEMNNHLILE